MFGKSKAKRFEESKASVLGPGCYDTDKAELALRSKKYQGVPIPASARFNEQHGLENLGPGAYQVDIEKLDTAPPRPPLMARRQSTTERHRSQSVEARFNVPEAAETGIDRMRKQKRALVVEKDALCSRIKTLEKDLSEKAEYVAQLQSTTEALTLEKEKTLENLTLSNSELESTVAALAEKSHALIDLENLRSQQAAQQAAELNQVRSALENQRNRTKDVEDRLEAKEAFLAELKEACTQAEERNRALEGLHSETESAKQELFKENDRLSGQVDKLTLEFKETNTSLTDAKQSEAELQVMVSELQGAISMKDEELSETKNELDTRSSTVKELESKLLHTQKMLTQLQGTHKEVSEQLEYSDALVTEQALQIDELRAENDELETKLVLETQKSKKFEEEAIENSATCDTLSKEVEEHRTSSEDLKKRLHENEKALGIAEKRNIELIQKHDDLQEAYNQQGVELQERLDSANLKIAEISKKSDKLAASENAAQLEIQQLQKEVDKEKSALLEERDVTGALKREVAQAKDRNEELRVSIEDLRGQLSESDTLVQQQKVNIAKLEEDLCELKDSKLKEEALVQAQGGELEHALVQIKTLQKNLVKKTNEAQSFEERLSRIQAELDTKKETAATNLALLQSKLEAKEQEVATIALELEDSKQACCELSEKVNRLETSLTSESTELTKLKAQCAAKEEALETLESANLSLQAERNEAQSSNEKMIDQLAQIQEELKDIVAVSTVQREELSILKQDLKASSTLVEKLSQTEKEMAEQLNIEQREKEQGLKEVSALRAWKEEANSRLEASEAQQSSLQGYLEQQRAATSTLQEKLNKAIYDKETEQKEKEEAFTKERQAAELVAKTQSVLSELQETHSEICREKKAMESKVDSLELKASKASSSIQAAEMLRERVASLENELDAALNKEGVLQTQLHNYRSQLIANNILRHDMDHKESELAETRAAQERAKEEMDRLAKENGQLMGHQNLKQKIHYLKKVKQENADLKLSLAKFEAKTKRMEGQIASLRALNHAS